MEDMELDQVVLVPDSPDRVDIRHINVERSKNQSNSSVYGSSLRENRNNGRRHWHPQRNPIDVDGYEPQNRSGTFSSFGNSPTQDGPFVRKAPMINNFNHESGLPTEQQHVDKGKKPIEQDDLNSIFNMTFPLGTSKNYDEERKGQTSSSNRACLSHSNPFPSRRSSSSYKGKEKIDCGGSNGSGLAINDQNVIDLSRGSPDENIEQVPMVHLPANLPRVPGCRRLVRNGCISPINIASHVQKSSESRHGGCSFVEKGQGQEMISDSQLQADIKEIVKESNNGRRSKGKEVLTSPTSHKHTTEAIYASRSNPVSSGKMTNQVNGACVQPSCSWRTMCNHASKNVRQSAAAAAASFVSEQHEKRASLRDNYVTTRLNSRSSPGLNRTSESYPKRQKRLGPTLETNHSSSAVSHDVEVLFLGSDHGLSSSRPSRLQSSQHDRVSHGLNTSSQVNETSPRTRRRGSQVTEHVDNDDSYARARQVEEDERLAREIQEQLYFEAPIFVADEINVDTASALQQEEYFNEHLLNDAVISMANEIDEDYVSFVEFGLPAVSSQNHTRSFNVNSSTLGPSGWGRSQSSSSRRANQAQAPTSGTLQWRTGFFNQPSATTSRQRRRFVRAPIARPSRSTSTSRVSRRFYPASARGTNISFPQGLDLDMGINMIEELGVAFLNEMSAGITFSNFIDGPLDVNGTDYEMWLALDENNHQSGVPIDRINSLPESVVQTENSEEICAICLETPATGETIRHLPCLHKFHKDCIDPWLSRKTTCPMCKASIA